MRLVSIKILLLTFTLLFGYLGAFGQNNKYQEAIQSANNYFIKADYMNAKASYQYALRFKKDDEFAIKRINECIGLMSAQTSERIQYSAFIQKADKQYKKKEYIEAIKAYKKALKLFSFEEYPQKQILLLNQIVRDNTALSADFQEAIRTGDRFYDLKKFANARLEYQYALSLYPEQLHPKHRLEDIDFELQDMSEKQKVYDKTLAKAQNFFNQGEWKNALEAFLQANKLFPNEEFPNRRINELAPLIAQLKKYEKIVEDADEYYMVKDLSNAKVKYEEALSIKPREIYPKEMLDKVILAIQTKATTELEDFNTTIAMGDQYIGQKQWKEARSQFEFANRLKPEEKYPKDMLTQIAEELKVEEAAAALLAKYEEHISNADLFLAAKDYVKAKQSYIEASKLFSENSYSRDKINEIIVTEQRISAEKAILEHYQLSLRKADSFYQKEKYISAKLAFEEARDLKPEETYPKEKITEISLILDRIAAQQTAEQNYSNAIQLANTYFGNEEYGSAQFEYQKALNYKNEEEYPQDQLVKIKAIFEQRAIALQLAYDNVIVSVDSLFALTHYEKAIIALKKANELKPNESYPKQKTSEIKAIVAENYRIAKINYDKFISDGDRFYKVKVYERALASYQEANNILAKEDYALTKIREIIDLFAAATIAIINEENITIKSGELKQLPYTPIPIRDRKSNYLYLLIKESKSAGNLRLIVNYGKDKIKNGGVIIRLTSNQKNNIHLVNVGTQYKWFSEDNNWISVQAEGGYVEIGLIKVSKGLMP